MVSAWVRRRCVSALANRQIISLYSFSALSVIYASALHKCKEINEQLVAQPWWDSDNRPGLVAAKVVESAPIRLKKPRLYDAAWVETLINKESENIANKRASKPELLQKVDASAHALIKVATQIKPMVDILVPQSPEYSIPYACLWILFKVCGHDVKAITSGID